MSLRAMGLRDFVIVRSLDLEFSSGLSVLTGETGAGKSILIDALQLALGARAEASVVREGATRCEISAEFDTSAPVQQWLSEAGFDASDSLLLKRTIDAQGKSRAWINGSAATATQLREVGDCLVDIHGQHAWQSLTRPDAVRGLLDAYSGIDTKALAALWQEWRASQLALEQAKLAQSNLVQERERLEWQISELEKLNPLPDEWETLNADHTRLSHAQTLLDAAQHALRELDTDDQGALAQLAKAQNLLADQAAVEPEFQNLADVLASSLAQTSDAAHSLQAWLRRTDLDPQRLQSLDERMGLWMSLARRYKRQPAELAALLQSWRHELKRLEQASDLAALEKALALAGQAYQAEARRVSQMRGRGAPKLAKAITQAMQGLGMQGGSFEVALNKLPQGQSSGLEEVVFLVAGHAGSTPRPVGKVASGGELSRIALAIAVTTSALGQAQTLIFDEVDSGVGGAVAETVGRLMQQLGADRQVLAVTHLPQVAACAHHHWVVTKRSDKSGSFSELQAVTDNDRVQEIARMLGGDKRSATSLAHAQEMLQNLSVGGGA
ncbi:RecN ATPase involved in DNA repair [Burkholderiaceae bacterium]